MSDWTAGYVADIGYTYGYYGELDPGRLKLPFLYTGLAAPEVATACELGFGQGMSVNIHAAARPVEWFGTDFNPSQAGFAQEIARATGSGARLFDDSFLDFFQRADLPEFDFIGLHGIWSWISDENRRLIVEFVRRKLKVGGVLYISYNTLPGWAAFAPLRHLMARHAETLGVSGSGIVQRIDGALDFVERLMAVNPGYARANPAVPDRLKQVKAQNRHYLAHEYFNRDWHPMHFATVAEWLAPAKLSFACSANHLDLVGTINLSPEQQELLAGIPDAGFRESVRDFITNQQFRKDYWVKGPRTLSLLEQAEQLRAQRVILLNHRHDVPLKAAGALGEATLNESIYAPILDVLADHKPHSIGQLELALKDKGIAFSQLMQSVMVLSGINQLAAVHDENPGARTRKQTERLNALIEQKARASADLSYIASPLTGAGHPVQRFSLLFLAAVGQGKKQPADLAAVAWQWLSAQGQKLLKDGQTLESPEENLAELTRQAEVFVQKQLPVLKALQVV